jgi:hypothetical protein
MNEAKLANDGSLRSLISGGSANAELDIKGQIFGVMELWVKRVKSFCILIVLGID